MFVCYLNFRKIRLIILLSVKKAEKMDKALKIEYFFDVFYL